MALTFPANPSVGQTYNAGDFTYAWDGAKWTSVKRQITNVFTSVTEMVSGPALKIGDYVKVISPLSDYLVGTTGDVLLDNGLYAREITQATATPVLQPRQIGDGIATSFDAPGTTAELPQAYFVAIDGFVQRPESAYTTNVGKVIFTETPPLGAEIDITYFKPVTTDVLAGTDVSLGFATATGSTTGRTLADRTADMINVKDFGAVGDDSMDNSDAFDAALAEADRTGLYAIYIPTGIYRFSRPLADTPWTSIYGAGTRAATLAPTFSSHAYLFNFTGYGANRRISNITVSGSTRYSTTESFVRGTDFSNGVFITDCTFTQLNDCLWLDECWSSCVQRCYASYIQRFLWGRDPNGCSFRDIYIQRYYSGISLRDGLSVAIDNVILEYGTNNGRGISLLACQGARITNVYTEGGDGDSDIYLGTANSRRNIDTVIQSCWFNSQNDKIIHAQYHQNLQVRDIVVHTPTQGELINLTDDFSAWKIRVSNVSQVDQNANGFSGDVRDTGQDLIPICQDNTRVILEYGSPKVGDGTNADVLNIANHTDATVCGTGDGNILPLIEGGLVEARNQILSDMDAPDATSSDIEAVTTTTGIDMWSRDYGSVALYVKGTVVNTAGNRPYFNIAGYNVTNSIRGRQLNTSVPATGDEYANVFYVNVTPGLNKIGMVITRNQGGGGFNRMTATDMLILGTSLLDPTIARPTVSEYEGMPGTSF